MDKTLPIFQVYAKRRNVDEESAHIYLRIIYQTDIIDRSTGVLCLYDQWQSQNLSIRENPVLTHQLQEHLGIVKHKIMGAFYILKQSAPEVSLQEIVAVALDEEKARAFSVYTCFEGVIAKMVNAKGNGTTQSNIQKHQVWQRLE